MALSIKYAIHDKVNRIKLKYPNLSLFVREDTRNIFSPYTLSFNYYDIHKELKNLNCTEIVEHLSVIESILSIYSFIPEDERKDVITLQVDEIKDNTIFMYYAYRDCMAILLQKHFDYSPFKNILSKFSPKILHFIRNLISSDMLETTNLLNISVDKYRVGEDFIYLLLVKGNNPYPINKVYFIDTEGNILDSKSQKVEVLCDKISLI